MSPTPSTLNQKYGGLTLQRMYRFKSDDGKGRNTHSGDMGGDQNSRRERLRLYMLIKFTAV